MARRSKIAFLVPIVLLLVRSLVPVAQGQILPLEWNHKSDPVRLYRQQTALPDRVFLTNPTNKYWSTVLDPSNPSRELVEISTPQLRNVRVNTEQNVPNVYLLVKEQKHPPLRSVPNSLTGDDVLEALNSKFFHQQPKKRQDQQKETEALLTGSGPPVDYSSDDEPSAQLVQPTNSNPEDESQLPSSKAKNKLRQAATANGLARYLIFSNLKRARDGYICHFKLCQVGVSGKRLSNM